MDQLAEHEVKALRRLIERAAIYDNVMRYCRGLDRFDIDLLKASYWPDATDNHGSFNGNAYEFCERSVAARHRFRNMNHHVGNTTYEFVGDNQAKVETYFLVQCTWILPDGDRHFMNGGRYKDLYEKRGSEWRILRRVCVFDWSQDAAAAPNWERSGTQLDALNTGRFSPDDPTYGPW